MRGAHQGLTASDLRESRAVQAGVLVLGLVAARLANPDHPLPIELCAFKHLTGFPCPTCGLTRALCHALRGEFGASMHFHPAGLLLGAVLIGWALWSAVEALRGRSLGDEVRRRLSASMLTMGLALSLASWILRFASGTWAQI